MRRILAPLILFVIFISVFALRLFSPFSRKYSPGMRIRITERLSEQPYQKGSIQIFRLVGFTVVTRRFPAYNYGDLLVIEGELKTRDDSDSSGVGGLLTGLRQDFSLVYPDISLVGPGEVDDFFRQSLSWRFGVWVNQLRLRLVGLFRGIIA